MSIERTVGYLDVLDRVLEKGIVIDAWVRMSVAGIDLITIDARLIVASIETFLNYSPALAVALPASAPAPEPSNRNPDRPRNGLGERSGGVLAWARPDRPR